MQIRRNSTHNYSIYPKKFHSAFLEPVKIYQDDIIAKSNNIQRIAFYGINRSEIPKKRSNGKQQLSDNVYFIRLKKYKKDLLWAKAMNMLTYKVSDMISGGAKFSELIDYVSENLPLINNNEAYGQRRKSAGTFILNQNGRGQEYFEKYQSKIFDLEYCDYLITKSNFEYRNANVCKIESVDSDSAILVSYGFNPVNKISNLSLAEKEYEKLKSINNPNEHQILKSTAIIHWLISQESPFERGNDSFAGIIAKSILHSYNMYISPLKEEKSIDFEAFYTDLNEFIKIYPELFEIKPYKKI